MKGRLLRAMQRAGLGILAAGLMICVAFGRAPAEPARQEGIAGVPREEALRLGERMYRDGILPSGEPLRGIIKGDIPVTGSQFTCANCHQRSGFGALEGTVRTPPINGAQLFAPISKFKGIPLKTRSNAVGEQELFRPAYTDETLARAIRTGQDPGGRQMSSTMPVYFLDDRDAAILVFYLKNLSTGSEAGVTDTVLRFATVIAGEVSAADREAMLLPLRDYIGNWRIFPQMERSSRAGAFVREGESRGLRRLSLSVWELKGPAGTWQAQLEDYYRKEPVFALLGGITTAEWEPVHAFCEKHRIPALFPITDFPVISDAGGYTFYLSKGLYQEGEAAARFLHRNENLTKKESIIQVVRNDLAGRVLARAFEETWTGLGHPAPEKIVLDGEDATGGAFRKKLGGKSGNRVVILWTGDGALPVLDSLFGPGGRHGMVVVSASLLGNKMYSLSENVRRHVYLTYPYALPEDARPYRTYLRGVLAGSDIPIVNPEITFKTQSLFPILTEPLSRMRSKVYREYFIELLEATPDLSLTPAAYPRLSFGAGQRYAAKGCYIVQLTEGPKPELVRRSDWITP